MRESAISYKIWSPDTHIVSDENLKGCLSIFVFISRKKIQILIKEFIVVEFSFDSIRMQFVCVRIFSILQKIIFLTETNLVKKQKLHHVSQKINYIYNYNSLFDFERLEISKKD